MEEELLGNIEIEKNNYNFDISDIIEVVATPKRQRVFYLLNKLVGNHLDVEPNKIRAVGHIMADLIYKNSFNTNLLAKYIKNGEENIELLSQIDKSITPKENVFILGLAKSATAIGMATADAIKDSYYISTIRETPIKMEPLFDFEESHTLLTNHRVYLKDISKLQQADRIIIVEDEITTGNTMINLIRKILEHTDAKRINIVTILNFSNKAFQTQLEELENEFNIKIDIDEILKGSLNYEKLNDGMLKVINNNFDNICDEITAKDTIENICEYDKINVELENGKSLEMMQKSGCFGISFKEIKDSEEKAKAIANKINNKYSKVLVITQGENMYIPSRVAYYINKNAKFKSTTQNTILAKNLPNYAINQISSFNANGIKYYLYNKEKIEKEYDKVYFIVDSDINIKLTKNTKIIKMSLFVIRHTQTDWNIEHKAQGKVNTKLNKTGILQAKELAKDLRNYNIDLIISSPLDRAKQTAEIVNEGRNIPIICDERIIERDFGEFEGNKPQVYIEKGFWDYERNVKYKKAESIKPFFNRIYNFLDDMEEKKKNKNILIVTHGAASIAIEVYYKGIPEDNNLVKLALKHGQIKEY